MLKFVHDTPLLNAAICVKVFLPVGHTVCSSSFFNLQHLPEGCLFSVSQDFLEILEAFFCPSPADVNSKLLLFKGIKPLTLQFKYRN